MVKVLQASELPFIEVPRISTRVHSDSDVGANETTVWEQWMESDGFIPMHYHDTEEVLVIMSGTISLELDGRAIRLNAPASIIVEQEELHGIRPVGTEKVHLFGIFPTAFPKIFDESGRPRPLPTHDQTMTENPYDT